MIFSVLVEPRWVEHFAECFAATGKSGLSCHKFTMLNTTLSTQSWSTGVSDAQILLLQVTSQKDVPDVLKCIHIYMCGYIGKGPDHHGYFTGRGVRRLHERLLFHLLQMLNLQLTWE